MKKKIIAAVCICVLSAATIMTGCTSEKKEPEKKTETTKKEELKAIGNKKDATYKVTLKNSTTKEITGVSIKYIEDEEYPENMLEDGDTFKVDEKRILYYTQPEKQNTEEQENASEDEKVLEEGFDIQLTFADNTVAELHSFPFEDIKEGELLYSDNVAYISYKSVKTEEKIETKEAELAIVEQKAAEEEAARQAEEAAQKAAEEEAARQAEEAAQKAAEEEAARQAEEAQKKSSYSAPEQNNSQPETQPQQPADTGTADGCIDDGLVY